MILDWLTFLRVEEKEGTSTTGSSSSPLTHPLPSLSSATSSRFFSLSTFSLAYFSSSSDPRAAGDGRSGGGPPPPLSTTPLSRLLLLRKWREALLPLPLLYFHVSRQHPSAPTIPPLTRHGEPTHPHPHHHRGVKMRREEDEEDTKWSAFHPPDTPFVPSSPPPPLSSPSVLTQREVYYALIRAVPDQKASDACVGRLQHVLRVTRRALGVIAGQRGSIGGTIQILFHPQATPQCLLPASPFPPVVREPPKVVEIIEEEEEERDEGEEDGMPTVPARQRVRVEAAPPPLRMEKEKESHRLGPLSSSLRASVLPSRPFSPHAAGAWTSSFSEKRVSSSSLVSPAVPHPHVDIPIPSDESHLGVLPWGAPCHYPPLSQPPSSSSGGVEGKDADQASSSLSLPTLSLPYAPPLFYLSPHTRAIIVVEKYSIYHRLLAEDCPSLFPCVILTSNGFPTHAARQLLSNIAFALRGWDPSFQYAPTPQRCSKSQSMTLCGVPPLPSVSSTPMGGRGGRPAPVLLALADYNPSGLRILHSYKFGTRWTPTKSLPHPPLQTPPNRPKKAEASDPFPPHPLTADHSQRIETPFCHVPDLRWVGLRAHHVLRWERCPRRGNAADLERGEGGGSTGHGPLDSMQEKAHGERRTASVKAIVPVSSKGDEERRRAKHGSADRPHPHTRSKCPPPPPSYVYYSRCPHAACTPRDMAVLTHLIADVQEMQDAYHALLQEYEHHKRKKENTKEAEEDDKDAFSSDAPRQAKKETTTDACERWDVGERGNANVPWWQYTHASSSSSSSSLVTTVSVHTVPRQLVVDLLTRCPSYNPLTSRCGRQWWRGEGGGRGRWRAEETTTTTSPSRTPCLSSTRSRRRTVHPSSAARTRASSLLGHQEEKASRTVSPPASSSSSPSPFLSSSSVGFLGMWLEELRVMKEAKVKVELDMLLDHPSAVTNFFFSSSSASASSWSSSQPSCHETPPPFPEGKERMRVKEISGEEEIHWRKDEGNQKKYHTPHGTDIAPSLSATFTPTSLETSKPLSHWLYQRILTEDYI